MQTAGSESIIPGPYTTLPTYLTVENMTNLSVTLDKGPRGCNKSNSPIKTFNLNLQKNKSYYMNFKLTIYVSHKGI